MLERFELHVVDRKLIRRRREKRSNISVKSTGPEPRSQARKAIARLDRHEIDVVAGLRPAEHGEYLVGGELFG